MNYERDVKEEKASELAAASGEQSSLATFILKSCPGSAEGGVTVESSSKNGGKNLEPVADLKKGTL